MIATALATFLAVGAPSRPVRSWLEMQAGPSIPFSRSRRPPRLQLCASVVSFRCRCLS